MGLSVGSRYFLFRPEPNSNPDHVDSPDPNKHCPIFQYKKKKMSKFEKYNAVIK